jgi:hypothetical protein
VSETPDLMKALLDSLERARERRLASGTTRNRDPYDDWRDHDACDAMVDPAPPFVPAATPTAPPAPRPEGE